MPFTRHWASHYFNRNADEETSTYGLVIARTST
jgi:hypothetical protein